MRELSVVIVCRNEAGIIGRTLESLQGITDDIVVYDNGSTDNTKEIVVKTGAKLFEGAWEGFGATKRKATALAKYDWILSLDADEAIDIDLKTFLLEFVPPNDQAVYEIRFKNFLGNKYLRYGEWGNDKHKRLFNRRHINWDDAPVHEGLILPKNISILTAQGFILHRTVNNLNEYAFKMSHYAMLNASKYFEQKKKSSWIQRRLAPGFAFIKYYFFKLGFLDGEAGYTCARMTAYYTFLKYARLRELNQQPAARS
jgi:glycosyltransferase involved in cell wall biosynthesis